MNKILLYLSSPYLWAGVSFFSLVEKFVFKNWDYLIFLAILMILDFATGVCKAWYRNEAITSKGLRGTVAKVIQYGSFLIVTHILINFSPLSQSFSEVQVLGTLAYNFLIMIEIKSVYENIIGINDKFDFLKGIVSRIERVIKSKSNE